MTVLPRGSCPVCGANVALRKGDLLREHRDQRQQLSGGRPAPLCSGSGQPALEHARHTAGGRKPRTGKERHDG